MPVIAAGNRATHSDGLPGPLLNVVCTGPATGTVVMFTVNVGPITVSGAVFDVPPPGAGVTTVMFSVPPLAMSLARIEALSEVALPNIVARWLPFTCTTELPPKFVPATARVNAGPLDVTEVGLIVVIVGAAGGVVTLSVDPFDVHTPP